ncbi:hypothetical protein [Flagellimonas oceanensis]|uniref:hypothetical protein n=1 Tax=Flagellimonas oceanensis TaxID=2499163 RepID=UPI003BAD7D89
MGLYKKVIWIVGLAIILIIGFVTFKAIYENPNWEWFNLDFTKRTDLITSYGTLIGGLLAFLSTLVVAYGLVDQNEKLLISKNEERQREIIGYRDNLILLSSFLTSIIDNIQNQGKTLNKFIQSELKNPTLANVTGFSVNKNFERIIEMDYSMIYKSIRHFMHDQQEWEKEFLNMYSVLDFYKEIIPHIMVNYQSQQAEKTQRKNEISDLVNDFLFNLSEVRNEIIVHSSEVERRKNQWFKVIDEFHSNYQLYIEEMKKGRDKESDLSLLRNEYFLPFHENLVKIKKGNWPEKFNESTLIDVVGALSIKIQKLEGFSRNYILNLKDTYKNYLYPSSENLVKLKRLKSKIDRSISV